MRFNLIWYLSWDRVPNETGFTVNACFLTGYESTSVTAEADNPCGYPISLLVVAVYKNLKNLPGISLTIVRVTLHVSELRKNYCQLSEMPHALLLKPLKYISPRLTLLLCYSPQTLPLLASRIGWSIMVFGA
jgi:hypothetical protein